MEEGLPAYALIEGAEKRWNRFRARQQAQQAGSEKDEEDV